MGDAWDGRPERPEVDGWHWLLTPDGEQATYHWRTAGECERGRWPSAWLFDRDAEWNPTDCTYLAPCLTPAELAAAVQAERAAAAEAMRETCAKWHDERGLAAMPGTGGLARHQWLSECIRGLPLPDTSALDAAIKAAEARGIERAAAAVMALPPGWHMDRPRTEIVAAIRARIEEAKGGGAS